LHFTKLKVSGFKSFVEPIEFRIEPGLTGVVGPNGCGKSNVMEALRWVMGATSAKALRAGGMDEVIFAGSANRPARNHAEVQMIIDNTDRTAPAAFNDADVLEVSRRITRGAGSVYKVNGREARARDVQRLFADASSGANSPALVRQGQISELIAAKPENRRRVLEEAAGVAGLASRRHEAELKLANAMTNLERLDDVLAGAERELDNLRRQSRQAKRYRKVAAETRALEALLAQRRFDDARSQLNSVAEALEAAEKAVEQFTRAAAEAAKVASERSAEVAPARAAETEAAGRLAQANSELDAANRELEQIKRDCERAEADRARAAEELTREAELSSDAETALKALEVELTELRSKEDASSTDHLKTARDAAEEKLATAQSHRDALAAAQADAVAQQRALMERVNRGEALLTKLQEEIAALPEPPASDADDGALTAAQTQAEETAAALEALAAEIAEAETAADAAAAAEREAAETFAEADRAAAALEAEIAALERALATDAPSANPAADAVTVEDGYERALAAALGDDLLADLEDDASMHWTGAETPNQLLPAGVRPLTDFVQAPDALAARLSQIGVLDDGGDEAAFAPPALKPGQRLVSRTGQVWRWDGFHVPAGAQTAAERRIAARATLDAATQKLAQKRSDREKAEKTRDAAKAKTANVTAKRYALRAKRPQAEANARAAQSKFAELERAQARAAAERASTEEARSRLETRRREEAAAVEEAREGLDTLSPPDPEALSAAATALDAARGEAADARGALEAAEQAAAQRRARIEAISKEIEAWTSRRTSAAERVKALTERAAELDELIKKLRAAPDEHADRLETLRAAKEDAAAERAKAADAVAVAETAAREADQAQREAEAALSAAREERAGSEVRKVTAEERLAEANERLAHAPPPEAGVELDEAMRLEEIEERLAKKTAERERMGPVNLRADEEADERESELTGIRAEREDLEAAVNKLRSGVRALDSEARERLKEAFEKIDGHFRDLFQTLFGGGEAKLALVDGDDPLTAGLDVYACPPGKRLASMALMSGGEQALTATALIFAVFLANPAPICALDEVDGPLDDANVGRFCDLLDAMRKKSQTRFVVITHNPVTMSRVDRLYGVTMAERGVSQLVSVDLAAAEALAAAS
jgi:chromosome segregation protein